MNPPNQELSREQLYDKVWSVPTIQLAAELGISDVALAKRCNKLNVPKPGAGYWAKVAAGQKPKKKPLPPTAQEIFLRDANKPVQKILAVPESLDQLHPLAAGLIQPLRKAVLFSDKRAHLRVPNCPLVIATPALAERAAKSFHVILQNLEPIGITFRKAQGSYGPGFFKKGLDRLFLELEEILVPPGTKVTEQTRSTWPHHSPADLPSGFLSFAIHTNDYRMRGATRWTESEELPLSKALSKVVTAIRQHFVETQIKRQRDAIEAKNRAIEWEQRMQEYHKKEAIRLREEQRRRHTEHLRSVAQARSDNLSKAADNWRHYRAVLDFTAECETRWRSAQEGALNREQELWLEWARNDAKRFSPFEIGYPDPDGDGPFDASSIPEGGPYPQNRNLQELPVPSDKPTAPAAAPS